MNKFLTTEKLLSMSKAEFRETNGKIMTTANAIAGLPENHWIRTLEAYGWGESDRPMAALLGNDWNEDSPMLFEAVSLKPRYMGYFHDGFDGFFRIEHIDTSWNSKAEELRFPWEHGIPFKAWWIHWKDWFQSSNYANRDFYENMGRAWADENAEKIKSHRKSLA